jgi:hypothetical protein
VTFSDVDFQANCAEPNGGAVYLLSRASQLEATAVFVKQGAFSENKAKDGASIYNLDGSKLTIEGSKYPPKSIHIPTARGS